MAEAIKTTMKTMDGNQAVAHIAYRVTEISAIYPITPSSTMGEWADQWSAEGKKNVWGTVPQVIELQSEAGASGTLHGALQTGSLATTYTASQGLLLMIPNMYKIAGELIPTVIHVSARTLATHALSIFGDHSDVMSVRQTGFALLCSNNVQEAHDFALISHAATLESRIPFLHFFEGFRTSHEVNKIAIIPDEQIKAMMKDEFIFAHRDRALNPNHPVIRGTAQNPDVFFQSREACNTFYEAVPAIVEKTMDDFAKFTGRRYQLMEYIGHPEAERIIVIMGSGAETVEETLNGLVAQGEKIGLVKIHLYRPFSNERLLATLPMTTKSIAVLDRTKEPGAHDPLYLDVVTALADAMVRGKLPMSKMPKVIAGRYGLSSKEFTPAMVKAVFDEMTKASPKDRFTVGIHDDVTQMSLEYDPSFIVSHKDETQAIFYGLGADGTIGANKNTIKIIGEETPNFAQGYFVYDSKKSGARTTSHLRFGPEPIRAPYLIQFANFIGCHQFNFVDKFNVLEQAEKGAIFLLNSPYAADQVWHHIPRIEQQTMIDKKISFYVIDAYKVAKETGMGTRINTIMQTCFFAISGVLPKDEAIAKIKEAIRKTYGKKGEDVVQQNFAAVDATLANLHQVNVPVQTDPSAHDLAPPVSATAPAFVRKVVAAIMLDKGDQLPVSAFPPDGTYPTATTQWEKRNVSLDVAQWNEGLCIQCGRCSVVCPHGVIRVKRYDESQLQGAPKSFKAVALREKTPTPKKFTLQIYVEDCTGCNLCHQTCPVKDKTNDKLRAINLQSKEPILEAERENIAFFEKINADDPRVLHINSLNNLQYLPPYFEFSGACAGCGETPYVKMISQLFGDRMLIANATGCSSIYGGNLPTTPWSVDPTGRGPAWANSLFEDNAEFGLGFRLAVDKQAVAAVELMQAFKAELGEALVNDLQTHVNANTDPLIAEQRQRIETLKAKLQTVKDPRAAHLLSLADYLVRHSVWIMGGDGWAYDIGYGGLDHVLSTGKDVNILVMDTEVYSNTGGQASKATPLGAIARFAEGGKRTSKKELGLMAMTYQHIYVAQIAMGANPLQALKAIKEAEAFDGPSLIIAYSHCITHGIQMEMGMDLQKMAVESGYWPLFRYNTDRVKEGLNPFVLESKKPTVAFKDYVMKETRFKGLFKMHPELAQQLLEETQKEIERRWAMFEKMAAAT
ncbi:MAG: pyruvate:ferredoxin (flavodoxin) oxidoreductase [Gammaproteobacteria bacterium GWE2_42_36]|nr:MAG: pyruvate:ferredoxin (flavodoxin) oxidoreductase [Gammaproteobacteria bacterium GWE2_42_36]